MRIGVLAGMVLKDTINVGGAERFLLEVLRNLTDIFSFDVICHKDSNINNEQNIVYHNVVNSKKQDSIIKSLFNSVDLIWSIDRLVDEKYKRPKLLTLGSLDYSFCKDAIQYGRWDLVIAMSDWLMFEINKMTTSKVLAIPLFVDRKFNEKEFIPKREILKFVSPHRPDSEKGHFESIDLIQKLIHNNIKCVLYFPDWSKDNSNGIDFKNSILEYCKRKGIANSIKFYNWSSDNFYKNYDIVLRLGGFREGFGLTIIEAISSFKPVICTGNGNIEFILPENSGLLKVNNPITSDEFAKIIDFISSPTIFYELSKGKDYIEKNYTVDKMVEMYKKVFYELLQ